jgi:hypothetical protein
MPATGEPPVRSKKEKKRSAASALGYLDPPPRPSPQGGREQQGASRRCGARSVPPRPVINNVAIDKAFNQHLALIIGYGGLWLTREPDAPFTPPKPLRAPGSPPLPDPDTVSQPHRRSAACPGGPSPPGTDPVVDPGAPHIATALAALPACLPRRTGQGRGRIAWRSDA